MRVPVQRMLPVAAFSLCAWQGAAVAAPATHVVVIEGMKFSPEVIEVHVGDTVIWKNRDLFPHSVTAEDHGFDSKEIPAGSSWKFKVKKAGTFSYVCTLHPTMKGRLVVSK